MEGNELEKSKSHIKDIAGDFAVKNFTEKEEFFLLLKKTEKLTTAMYLLTDFLDGKESLKWELRTKAVSFLSFITSSFSSGQFLRDTAQRAKVRKMIGEILSFLELALNVRIISIMNFSILKEEYSALGESIVHQAKREDFADDVMFPKDFFAGHIPQKQDKETGEGGESKGQYKGHTSLSKGQNYSDMSFIKKNSQEKKTKKERQDIILRLMGAKGEVSIKDIVGYIPNCSEKTVQRELMSLIANGVVGRKGERRWSTYVLKTQSD